jgi:glucose-6-phosphate isomerase
MGGLLFDFSKTHLDAARMALLLDLAREAGVEARREAMFAARRSTRPRAGGAAHRAPRDRAGPILVDGVRRDARVLATRARMEVRRDVRSGLRGAGRAFTDVVNIGIGGSDLGPAMATLALAPYHDGPRVHYVSNVDGAHIHDTLKGSIRAGRW